MIPEITIKIPMGGEFLKNTSSADLAEAPAPHNLAFSGIQMDVNAAPGPEAGQSSAATESAAFSGAPGPEEVTQNADTLANLDSAPGPLSDESFHSIKNGSIGSIVVPAPGLDETQSQDAPPPPDLEDKSEVKPTTKKASSRSSTKK